MKYIKFTFLAGLFLTLIGCASSGRPAVPNSPGAYDHVQYFSTRDAFKELLMTHQPSDKELKAREALRIYLQQFDNYGFVHSESPAPGQVGYESYINEHGKPAFRFSYAYFSEKHDGIVLVSLWDDPENQGDRPQGVIKNIKDEYELTIPGSGFCYSTLNAKELSGELTEVLQDLSPERKSKLMDIQRHEASVGGWAFHPGAFRLGNDAGVGSVVSIVSNNHISYVQYYYLIQRESRHYSNSYKGNFDSVRGCLLKTSQLTFLKELTGA